MLSLVNGLQCLYDILAIEIYLVKFRGEIKFIHCVYDVEENIMEYNRKISFFICFILALFPFYAYLQMDMINVMAPNFINAGFNHNQISLLFSGYLYTVALFLLPAGMMLDHYHEDTVIYLALILMFIGALLFSVSHSFENMIISRIVSAIGHAFSLASCLKITARVVCARDYGLATGSIMTVTLCGSMLVQTPLAMLITKTNIHTALIVVALIGILIIIAIKMVMIRYHLVRHRDYNEQNKLTNFLFDNAKKVLLSRENLLCALYMCAITCPTAWLSELWGVTYLTDTNHISVINASMVTSMLFLGTIIGSPLCGYLSDRVQNRKIPMIMGAFISLIVTVIIFNYQLHLTLLLLFFFLIGFFASTYSLGYSIAIEFNQKELLSTASGLINVIIVLGVSSFLSTYSALLSTMSEQHLGHKYTLAFWLLIVSFTMSLIVALFLEDTDQAKNKLQNELLSKYV